MSKKGKVAEEKLNGTVVQEESTDKIERIRDLILGPHLRDITQRFATMSKDLSRFESEVSSVAKELRDQSAQLQQELKETEKRITSQLQEATTELRDQSMQLQQELKETETRSSDQLAKTESGLRDQATELQKELKAVEKRTTEQLNEKLSGHQEQVNQLDQRISGQVNDLNKQFMARLQELVKDIRDLELNNRSELRQTADEMNQAKMDRFSLGELFTQLGNGLKASQPEDEIASLLNELQDEIG